MVLRTLRNLVQYSLLLQMLPASKSYMPRSTIRLVLDWDGTLTKKDTLHLVSAIGYEHNRAANLTSWDDIVQAYISDYTQHKARYTPSANQRKTVAEQSQWLASLKEVERRSIERVKAAGIFKGVIKQDVVSASRSAVQDGRLQLRPGWKKLMMKCDSPGKQGSTASPFVSLLSVNWSATFIRASLETAFSGCSAPDDTIMDSIPVYANELPLEEVQQTPYICTSADKLAKFKEVRGTDESIVVYVGDSATDFDCLVAADVGICIRDDPMGSSQRELEETLDQVGFETLRLNAETFKISGSSVADGDQRERQGKRIIWWVAGLDEIASFVEEIQ
jgi:phosphoglycolate phosphatase-like HAD superfamily hydrolase